jgi:hypothetical protein
MRHVLLGSICLVVLAMAGGCQQSSVPQWQTLFNGIDTYAGAASIPRTFRIRGGLSKGDCWCGTRERAVARYYHQKRIREF